MFSFCEKSTYIHKVPSVYIYLGFNDFLTYNFLQGGSTLAMVQQV